MKKRTKIWMIVAASLMGAGIILFGVILAMLGWDFSKLSTDRFETNTYVISEAYQDLVIDSLTADVTILPSEDGTTKIVCYEEHRSKHAVFVENGSLTIDLQDERKWYEYIGIHVTFPRLTVYLPAGEYGKLSVKLSTGDTSISKDLCFASISLSASTGDYFSSASVAGAVQVKLTTGDIRIEGCKVGSLDLDVTTGDITVSDVTCAGKILEDLSTGDSVYTNITCSDFTSDATTGNLKMNHLIATAKITITRSTGDIRFDGCDGGELLIKSTTGDVIGRLLSEKIFIAKASIGDVSVPETTTGGKCKITTDTGDIRISIG